MGAHRQRNDLAVGLDGVEQVQSVWPGQLELALANRGDFIQDLNTDAGMLSEQ